MAIEVEDVVEELGATSPAELEVEDAKASPLRQDNSAAKVKEATAEELKDLKPKGKARGRPPGSKNRPKAVSSIPVAAAQELEEESLPEEEDSQPVIVYSRDSRQRKPKKVPQIVYISESEEEPPPSPATQRRNEWAAYRQKQVNAHQARSAHYTKALDKMLAF